MKRRKAVAPEKKLRRRRRKSANATELKRTKANAALAKQTKADTDSITLDMFAAGALKEYGSYVVEERSVPDFRDGLKPVHRYILWAMKELGLNHKSAFKKSARTIGDVLGKYHPHGDAAAYGAMVTLANTQPKLVQGSGNWGSPVDPAAAMRYTEARLSVFSDIFLLDSGYLKTVPQIDNFDQSLKVPLYLPATLPVLMCIGSSGIGFGIAASNPPMALDGVVNLTISALNAHAKNKKVGPKACAKHLEISYPFGCVETSGDEAFEQLVNTGKGSIKFSPQINADWSSKTIELVSYAPGFRSVDTIQKKLDKLSSLDGVSTAGDNSGRKNPKSGPMGAYYYVKTARGVSEDKFYDIADQVSKIVEGSESYDLGFTIRHADKPNQFYKAGFVAYFNNWVKYRIQLERDYIQVLINEAHAEIEKLELLVFAVDHRKQILACLESKDPDTALSKKLKIPLDKAKRILDLQVRKLAKLEKSVLLQKIKEIKQTVRSLKQDDANPVPRIIKSTKEQYSRYKTAVAKIGEKL